MKVFAWIKVAALPVLLGLAACERSEPRAENAPPASPTAPATAIPDETREHWDYLNRLRQSDAYDAIDRTLVNEEGRLGVVLAPKLPPEKTANVMEDVMWAMARKFPGKDLTVDAYVPVTPLRRVGTASFNAQTGAVAFAPAK